jgi:hypothetical protein
MQEKQLDTEQTKTQISPLECAENISSSVFRCQSAAISLNHQAVLACVGLEFRSLLTECPL